MRTCSLRHTDMCPNSESLIIFNKTQHGSLSVASSCLWFLCKLTLGVFCCGWISVTPIVNPQWHFTRLSHLRKILAEVYCDRPHKAEVTCSRGSYITVIYCIIKSNVLIPPEWIWIIGYSSLQVDLTRKVMTHTFWGETRLFISRITSCWISKHVIISCYQVLKICFQYELT